MLLSEFCRCKAFNDKKYAKNNAFWQEQPFAELCAFVKEVYFNHVKLNKSFGHIPHLAFSHARIYVKEVLHKRQSKEVFFVVLARYILQNVRTMPLFNAYTACRIMRQAVYGIYAAAMLLCCTAQ